MQARVRTAVGLALTLIVITVGGAWAQADDLAVTVQEATFDDDGATSIVVSVTGTAAEGPLEPDSITVREAGQDVDGVTVTPIDEAEQVEERTIVVLFDTSGSTQGEPLAQAKAAASQFVRTVMGDGVSVALVTFSDTANLVEPPTREVDTLVSRIDALEASGETAFFDAVLVAARTLQSAGTQGSIVAFTDGADTASEAGLDAALNAAGSVEASVSAVALSTEELDLTPLRQLTDTTAGLLAEAASVDEIGSAFSRVAASLTNLYVIEYSSAVASGEFDVTVEVALGSATASDTITLLSPRDGRAIGQPRVIEVEDPGIFTSQPVLWGALGALFLGLLVIVGFVIVPTGDQRVARTLERGMRVYRRGEGTTSGHGGDAAGRIGRGAVGLVGSVPKPEGYDERLQVQLDRASWPLRAAEFTAIRVIGVLLAVLVGWGIFDNLGLALILAVATWVVPSLVLQQRVRARQQKFLSQLPDTLQLLAGALKAGYGILQGIDTIVKEVPEPTSSEFQRVLTEARLGVPLEEALESMADRIGSEDFRWVTVAINIQRRVGGNLAELLETVSETLREREMVRRQISALSAEGRLSAMILTVLPFGLAGYLWIVNPDYIGQLFSRTVGQLMIAGAIMLMIVGILWMRRLIDIDV